MGIYRVFAVGVVLCAFCVPVQGKVDCHTQIDPNYVLVDVMSLIHIESPADIVRLRGEIVELFWPGVGLPKDRLPAKVQRLPDTSVEPERAIPEWIESLETDNPGLVDRLDIAMDYDMHSYVYHLHPKRGNNRLLIFQMGHSGDILTAGGRETIKHFLDEGYSVMTLWMPLFGENTRTAKNVPDHGTATFPSGTGGHNIMSQTLDNSAGCFIRFFIEPVVVAINHAEAKYEYSDINMIGISGGGWTTHICAAIDTRIKLSFPVAGALPLYLRRGPCPNGSQGDAEQEWAALFVEIASWLDIYIMGAYGAGRKQIHILNQYDACCFWGVNYTTYLPFVKDTMLLLDKEGGYDVWLDSSHKEHKISQKAIEEVIDKNLVSATP